MTGFKVILYTISYHTFMFQIAEVVGAAIDKLEDAIKANI